MLLGDEEKNGGYVAAVGDCMEGFCVSESVRCL